MRKKIAVGVTGSRHGLSEPQRRALDRLLDPERAPEIAELHHGDCVGADQQVHAAARAAGVRVVVHPPERSRLRAWCEGDETLPPLPYADRNAAIVAAADEVWAFPVGAEVRRGSGTWMTVRMAREAGRPLVVVPRNGMAVVENFPAARPPGRT